jgi:glycine amidinotransferase
MDHHDARFEDVPAAPATASPVLSYNEWDPLEEVILGVADGAAVPPWNPMLSMTMPEEQWEFFRTAGGRPFPDEVLDAARRDLDGLAALLEREGVTVRSPERTDHARPFATPDWASPSGLYAAMPRDVLLVVGDEIIEAPMAWRCRYFEVHAYRALIAGYFRAGARWTAAPKPALREQQYAGAEGARFCVTEHEPTFDAADFIRCGDHLFAQRSHVTNGFGIEWLRRHLAPAFEVVEIETNDPHPMHLDATLMPLAPGKLLANPERLPVVPPHFRNWEVRYAPPPSPGPRTLYMSSDWISMNVLSLDERRVIVESRETALMDLLRGWGIDPIPCAFRGFNALGGSFHCATADVRRRGTLQSYFE